MKKREENKESAGIEKNERQMKKNKGTKRSRRKKYRWMSLQVKQ